VRTGLEVFGAGPLAQRERLDEVLRGQLEPTQDTIGLAEVVQDDRFAALVSGFPAQGQRFAEVFEGRCHLAELDVQPAEVGQDRALPGGPPGLSGEGRRLGVLLDGRRVVALAPGQVGEAEPGHRLAVWLAVGAGGGQRGTCDG
jgi:hypothetical protein